MLEVLDEAHKVSQRYIQKRDGARYEKDTKSQKLARTFLAVLVGVIP